jgi:hypothetical protein
MASEKECLPPTEEGFYLHAGQRGERNLLSQLSLNSKDNFNFYILFKGVSQQDAFFICSLTADYYYFCIQNKVQND